MPDLKTDSLTGFDPDALYSLESFTDMVAGKIDVFTPVTVERTRDVTRPIRFMSSVNMMFNGMPGTVGFEIPATTLAEAIELFPQAAQDAAAKQVDQLEARRLQQNLLRPGIALPN